MSTVYANTPGYMAGHVVDTNGEKGLTVEQAVRETGLDWTVEKRPSFYPVHRKDGSIGEYAQIPGRFSVVRTDTQAPLGVVGKTWHPFQNMDGFQLIEDVIDVASGGKGKVWIEAGGDIDNGKKVWMLVRIEDDYQIAGEEYQQYMLFINGHDGRQSLAMATTNVRYSCQNMNTMVLKENPRIVRVRHTTKAADRVKEALHLLGLRNQYAEQLAIQGEFLAEQSVTDGQVDRFLASLFPIKDGAEDTPAGTMAKERRAKVQSLFYGAPNLQPIRGTRWGLVQAAIEYSDYGREFASDDTTIKNQFGIVGSGTELKDRAFAIVKEKKLVLA